MIKDSILQIIEGMSLIDKCALLSGKDVFTSRGFEKYAIPSMFLSDGPNGVRKQAGESDHLGLNPSEIATCFPTAVTVASTWDESLIEEIGTALGKEASSQKVSVLLGPGLNIKRSPLCGRDFEYYSEDPYVAGKVAAAYIRGIQKSGISACPKHFAVNSQETRRMASDSIVDERTMREIYLTGFEMAVKEGGAKTIMTSYNLINGVYANEDAHLLKDILRKEWGYDGMVVTDWGGSNDHAMGVKNGSSLEMPAPGYDSVRELEAAVKSGKICEADVDDRVYEVLNTVFSAKEAVENSGKIDFEGHHDIARRAAASGAVLLKNEGAILPLKQGARVAFIGDFAEKSRYQGAGSSAVNSYKVEHLLEVVQGPEFKDSINFAGYEKGFERFGEANNELITKAVGLAGESDVVVFCMGLDEIKESEGIDRMNIDIAKNQIECLKAVSEKNPNVVVVLYCGSVVDTSWDQYCKGLLYAGLSGDAGAGAIADLLLGNVNPSGRLTETWVKALSDVPSSKNFAHDFKTVEYREGPYVGYRYFETAGVPVAYPFGYGLSYTSFEYSGLSVTGEGVSFTVKNTGSVFGAEVAQLYVSLKGSGIYRPVRELKGFTKVFLEPGREKQVTISFDDKTFRFFNVSSNQWEIEGGEYEILVGASVSDIKLSGTVAVEGTMTSNPYDGKSGFGKYFSGQVAEVSDEEFASLLARPIPPKKAVIDRNITFGELVHSRSLIGILIGAIMGMLLKKSLKSGKPDLNIFFVYNMPLRALAKMTGGAFSMGMVDGLVMEFKGFWTIGLIRFLGAFIVKLFRDMSTGSRISK